MRLLSFRQCELGEGRVVVLNQATQKRVTRVVCLDQYFTRLFPPTRSSGYLQQCLGEPLVAAEIRAEQLSSEKFLLQANNLVIVHHQTC